MISIREIEARRTSEISLLKFDADNNICIKTLAGETFQLKPTSLSYIPNGHGWILVLTNEGSYGLHFEDVGELTRWWQALQLFYPECSESLCYVR